MYALKSLVAFTLLVVPALAVPQGGCSPAQIQCCDNSAPGNSDQMHEVGKALKLNIDPSETYGIGCTPGGTVGGGESCTSTPMCCENNTFGGEPGTGLLGLGGLINVGCVPLKNTL
ncbi:hypothetical protein CERSUDRAFT_96114 [Gelatoporia subvermispora B]|uniref:Hydrophobin n=1 Tax=Ceriporiopsis subvermispora (strain B) TaxID=914234 RepID=M2PIC9_CERS8|nr:hypothetical protein CERSUDRAFT_96114 [Gelatoporia subvermispora B]